MVSGAQRTIKDLEQLFTTSADAIEECIEEAMQAVGVAAGSGMAGPVLSKSSGPQGQHHTLYAQLALSCVMLVFVEFATANLSASLHQNTVQLHTKVVDF